MTLVEKLKKWIDMYEAGIITESELGCNCLREGMGNPEPGLYSVKIPVPQTGMSIIVIDRLA